ncbi:MAG: DinB family protein [Gemmataceae bacterium]
MNSKDAIKGSLKATQDMLNWYLSDLADADILVRPVPNANHIAWQLGHLIGTENGMFSSVLPNTAPVALPAGFAEQHATKTASQDPPKGFLSKADYVALFTKTRETTIGAVDKMSDADLDKPTPGDMAKWAPTLAALLILTANHTMMHAGQFTVVRRKLGKPVLF